MNVAPLHSFLRAVLTAAAVPLFQVSAASAFVIPATSTSPSLRRPFSPARSTLSPPFERGVSSGLCATDPTSLMTSLDFGAQVSDGVQTFAFGFLIVVLILVAASTYVTKVAVPEQMARLAVLVQKENPEKWADIQAKLGDGEKLTDRPDLMAELVDSGVGVMVTENQGKMDSLLESVVKHRDSGLEVGDLREPLEQAFGMTIEEFVAGVEKAKGEGSKYVTETDSKMAELLRKEVLVATAKGEKEGQEKSEEGR